ncbi:AraC family transcriptional regulator [Myroides pelagicus]|uniref:helix-turn-helix domain-containing protein n=1 Tax=Myroides pelagicus TaxID=270914 RepID=UPI002DB85193|nr:AraC family transcriptional regulator [Myroides pelagicus]MEC4114167.1 AraC family transcriptional regulator [Myroides pelagicus]
MFPTLLLLFTLLLIAYSYQKQKKEVDFRMLLLAAILTLNGALMYLAVSFGLQDEFALGLVFSFFSGGLLVYLIKGRAKYLFVHFYAAVLLTFLYVLAYLSSFDIGQVNKIGLITTGVMNISYASYGYVLLSRSSLKGSYRLLPTFYIVSQFVNSFLGVSFMFLSVELLSHITIYSVHILVVLFVSLLIYILNVVREVKSSDLTTDNGKEVGHLQRGGQEKQKQGERELKIVEIIPVVSSALPSKLTGEKSDENIRRALWEKVIEPQLYLKQGLTLARIATDVGLNQTELRAFFARSEAATFSNYINRFRIEHAVNLIKAEDESALSVERLAEASGFKSRTSFYRAFVHVMGFAPSEMMEN